MSEFSWRKDITVRIELVTLENFGFVKSSPNSNVFQQVQKQKLTT